MPKKPSLIALCLASLAVASITLTPNTTAHAGDLEDGWHAYQTGDYATAFATLHPLAESGDAQAQHYLGFLYRHGHGVTQNYTTSFQWYRRAAEQDYAPAQHNLGFLYMSGQGVMQDFRSALVWFNVATANGYVEAREAVEIAENSLSPSAINTAQALAQRCLGSGYRDCP